MQYQNLFHHNKTIGGKTALLNFFYSSDNDAISLSDKGLIGGRILYEPTSDGAFPNAWDITSVTEAPHILPWQTPIPHRRKAFA
jgi:hypothetical protein